MMMMEVEAVVRVYVEIEDGPDRVDAARWAARKAVALAGLRFVETRWAAPEADGRITQRAVDGPGVSLHSKG
jgi:hypothetical protein